MVKTDENIQKFVPPFQEDVKEVTFTPEETAGINTNQINQGIGIEGASGGGAIIKNVTRAASTGTGTQQITGLGTLKYVHIHAWYDNAFTGERWSDGYHDGSTTQGRYVYHNISAPTGRMIYITDSTFTNRTRATFNGFVTDGIELDFLNSDYDIKYTIIG